VGPAELLVNVGKTGDEVLNAISTASALSVPQARNTASTLFGLRARNTASTLFALRARNTASTLFALRARNTASALSVPQGVKHREGTVGRQDVQNRHRPDAWIGAREGVRRT